MIPLLHKRATSECFRDEGLIRKHYINSSLFTLLYKLRCKCSTEKLGDISQSQGETDLR